MRQNMFLFLYLIFCIGLLSNTFAVLLHMTRKTDHLRRFAFSIQGFGAFLGVLEVWSDYPPVTSMAIMLLGFGLLILAGTRRGAKPEQHSKGHRHAAG